MYRIMLIDIKFLKICLSFIVSILQFKYCKRLETILIHSSQSYKRPEIEKLVKNNYISLILLLDVILLYSMGGKPVIFLKKTEK